ncbi:serine kinase [Spirosoma litoris]
MDLITHYYSAYGLTLGSQIPLPPLTEIEPCPVDVFIKLEKIPSTPPLQPTKIYRAGLQAEFAQTSIQELWLNWGPLLAFKVANGNEIILDTNQTDEELLSLFTLSEALGLILFQRGYFLLHGSAIQLNDKGIVFLGEPGAGKSTTVAAFAQKGVSVISDDMVCIQISKTEPPVVIPAFPQIKIWENAVNGLQLKKDGLTSVREGVNKFSWHDSSSFTEKAVPLNQIFVLTTPNEATNTYSQVPQHQIPIELLAYFPLADSMLKGEPLKNFFEKSVLMAHAVSITKMSRPADFVQLYAFVDDLKANS